MSGTPPLFSVLITSYNRPEFVGAAVASVLASGVDDIEVVVSDDCSPRQAEIRAALAPYLVDGRVRFHPQTVNLREAGNRAFLQRVARGEWRLFLADDDTLHASALRVLMDQIRSNPDVRLFLFGYVAVIDEHNRVRYSRRAPAPVRLHRDSDRALLRDVLAAEAFPYWFCQPATFCCHRDVHDRVAPNAGVGIADDMQFLYDYVNGGGIIHVVPRVLMSYRRMSSPDHQSNQSLIPLANPHWRYRILAEMEARADLSPSIAAIVATEDFRRRFVYRAVALACETTPVGDIVNHLGMTGAHAAELKRYLAGRSARSVRLAGYVSRCRFFVGLFGVRGAIEVIRVAIQRAWARLWMRPRPVPAGRGVGATAPPAANAGTR